MTGYEKDRLFVGSLSKARSEAFRDRWVDVAVWALISLPLLSLVHNEISWLRFGIDIPYWDDWRSYVQCGMGSFSTKYLFTPTNGTLYPVGLALDSLAQRFLDGNTIAYQSLTMLIVLGCLLLLQWRLLLLALEDKLFTACAFSFTVLMLQPDSYWGYQNIAYHQALPLVFDLMAIYIVLSRKWNNAIHIITLLLLGLMSGFSYISGAFSTLTIGIVLIFAGIFIRPGDGKSIFRGGMCLLIAGLISATVQVWMNFFGKATVLGSVHLVLPLGSDFWLYLLGKIARSLMLPEKYPAFSLSVTLMVSLAVIVLLVSFTRRFANRGKMIVSEATTAVILFSLVGAVFVYLLIVASVRSYAGEQGYGNALAAFEAGFPRFHYFWATLVWPWIIAAIIKVLSGAHSVDSRRHLRMIAIAIPAVLLPLFVVAGVLSHVSYHRTASNLRAEGIRSLMSLAREGKVMRCPQLWPRFELTEAVAYARSIGASFVRLIPIPHVPVGTVAPPPLFRMSDAVDSVDFRNVDSIEKTERGLRLRVGNDSRMVFKTGVAESLGQCLTLEVCASMRVSGQDTAMLFYKVPYRKGIQSVSPKTARILPGEGFTEVSFELSSPTGFVDEFAFLPVTQPQKIDVVDLEVRCRMSRH
ncbi:MAG: hypothetical protein ABFD97_08090 [Syntrophobacter sp.]